MQAYIQHLGDGPKVASVRKDAQAADEPALMVRRDIQGPAQCLPGFFQIVLPRPNAVGQGDIHKA